MLYKAIVTFVLDVVQSDLDNVLEVVQSDFDICVRSKTG